MNNDWLEVLVDSEAGTVEDIEAWLFAAGALSVTLRDHCRGGAIEHAVLEPAPGEMRLWDVVTVVGLFAQSESVESVKDALYLTAGLLQTDPPDFTIDVLQDKPWERVWLERFKPMQFGRQLWLCPTQAQIVDPAAVTLRLDPGLAFGTGTHPTTSQCLTWLGEKTARTTQPMIGKTVIDYGCGSGILAIACLLLGAEHAWAVDIDEQALQASQENARINGVQDRLSLGLPESVTAQSVDLVMANILFKPLMDLADVLAHCVKPSGELILSGILESQASPLRMRYNRAFEFSDTRILDGWVMLSASRRLV